MDWVPVTALIVGNGLTIMIAIAAHARWQQSRQDKRFDQVWEAIDARVQEIAAARRDFQGAIGRIERDLGATIKAVADALSDHRVDDAKTYVTRTELAQSIANVAGEIKGLREDIRRGGAK